MRHLQLVVDNGSIDLKAIRRKRSRMRMLRLMGAIANPTLRVISPSKNGVA